MDNVQPQPGRDMTGLYDALMQGVDPAEMPPVPLDGPYGEPSVTRDGGPQSMNTPRNPNMLASALAGGGPVPAPEIDTPTSARAAPENPLEAIGKMLGFGGTPTPTPAPAAPAAPSGGSQPIAGQQSDMEQNPEQQEIFKARQALRAQERALTAQIAGTSNLEFAKSLDAQRQKLSTYDQQLQSLYIGTLKPKGSQLTEEERTTAGLPTGVYNRSAEGAISPISGTQEEKDVPEVAEWKAVNTDRATRGEPPLALNDFHLEKTASAQGSNVIKGRDGQPVDDTLTGDALYAAVPGPVARMAKGMADGSIKIPNLTVRTDPIAKQAFLVASAADPSLLDVNKVAARHEIESGYSKATPGSLGGQVNAGNTAGDHLADVVEAANDLKNTSGGGVPLVAHIANNLRNNITTGQAGKAGSLEDGLLHYGEEIAKFYAGAQTGETERLRFLSSLGAAKSPEEMAGVFRMEARQLGGKFITLNDQVQQVMGPAASKYPVVRATSKDNARRITEGLASLDPTGQEAAGGRSPTDIWPGVGPTARALAPQGAVAQPQRQGPPPGFIKGGFRFKGGDPAQQANWERAQ